MRSEVFSGIPASSVAAGVPSMLSTLQPGFTPAADPPGSRAGGGRTALGVDRRDEEPPVDEPDLEPGLAAEVHMIVRAVRRAGNAPEVGKAEPAEHLGQDTAQFARRFGGNSLGTQFLADAIPFGEIERRIEVRVLDDLPDRVERLARLVGLRRDRARADRHARDQRDQCGGAPGARGRHLISALIAAGSSNTDGSTLS